MSCFAHSGLEIFFGLIPRAALRLPWAAIFCPDGASAFARKLPPPPGYGATSWRDKGAGHENFKFNI